MKNVILIESNNEKLVSSTHDGTNRLFINDNEIDIETDIIDNSGTYTDTDTGAVITTDLTSVSGNIIVQNTGTLTYELVNQLSEMEILFDFFYPVHSYYETSDSAFDPNTAWYGTWELETEGQVHVSAGSNYAVSGALNNATDGGEATHTLTAAESGVPAHGHGNTFALTNGANAVYSTDAVSAARASITSSSSSSYSIIRKTYSSSGSAGKHNITLSGSVSNNTAASASSAHNNMQPYINVYRWHRTA